MTKDIRLGEFELLVLLSILRLGKDAYGASIKRLLFEEICREVSIGSLYSTLERLEAKGMVVSEAGEPTPKRGGRAKSYLRITAKGQAAVNLSKENLTTMWDGLDLV